MSEPRDSSLNAENAGIVNAHGSRIAVRVIATDEERMIAKSVCRVLRSGTTSGASR